MTNVDLRTVDYSEFPKKPLAWSFDGLILGQINLVVGKNATGKSRVLSAIAGLAKMLKQDKLRVNHGNYDASFLVEDGRRMRYVIRFDEGKVLEEKVFVDDVLKLDRDEKTLRLRYEKQDATIDHEPAPNEVSAAARKDTLQHPFLILLHDWAQSVRHYKFGEKLGQHSMMLGIKVSREELDKEPEFDDSDPDKVVGIFLTAQREYPDAFLPALLADMKELGFPVKEIGSGSPANVEVRFEAGGRPLPVAKDIKAISITELDIDAPIFQTEMSQGMFRALSVLAQVNYSQLSKRAHCVIIDDIGEGLDFERSSQLIELLRKKARDSHFQLLMSTNDQFVMNHVPLDEWSVLQRKGGKISVKNIHNSKAAFEDFRFVGMSNFTFFEMDFANAATKEDRRLILEGMANDE